ncbi:MAG: ribonuclease HII, partial [Clostridia bacterium]|nr:ribonuclease HII [Clostridia bacterium]
GYGTAAHIAAIRRQGPTPEHRRSFIRKFLQETESVS